jgi:hypothetical protein
MTVHAVQCAVLSRRVTVLQCDSICTVIVFMSHDDLRCVMVYLALLQYDSVACVRVCGARDGA